MAGKFIIQKQADGTYRFALLQDNEEIGFAEGFEQPDAAKRAVKAVKKSCRAKVQAVGEELGLPKYEICPSGKCFKLIAQNGNVVLQSKESEDVQALIDFVQKNAPTASMEMAAEKAPSESEQRQIRVEKLKAMQAEGNDPFTITTAEQSDHSDEIIAKFEALEKDCAEGETPELNVSVCGRIMTWRNMGKANFLDIHDKNGKIQVYVRMNDIGEEAFAAFKKWDLGDIIEVKGFVFRTRTGEISVHAKQVRLLSKSLLPLPEKFHGLKDTDTRYRRRYLDLIMNPEVKDTFIKRSKIVSSIRNYLDNIGFIEVETPMLNNIPGGATARPFITHHNALDIDMYMRSATELHLKRLIVGGMERVYEIGRIFRNEGMDARHNPEFTTIELYQAFTDYHGMMDITEALIRNAAQVACGTTTAHWKGEEIDLGKPFARLTMIDAVKQYAGVDFSEFVGDTEKAKEVASKYEEIEIKPTDKWGDLLAKVFEETVEANLTQPTFIIDYPVEVSPLTKKKPGKEYLTERFELFICGCEFANAYSELNDPIDQYERFMHQIELREAGDDEANMLDSDFVMALEYGMPPTGGMGMGIDRLVMLLTNSDTIRDVLLFPTMKPLSE